MKIRIVKKNGEMFDAKPKITSNNDITKITLSKEDIGDNTLYIDFLYDHFIANVGDEGYFVLPFDCQKGVCLTRFTPREDTEYVSVFSHISCYGYKKANGGVFGIVTGCREYYTLVAGVKAGVYYAYPRFLLDGFPPQEDVIIEYYNLQIGDYSEMARLYRSKQVEYHGCIPLSERIKKNPILAKSTDSIAVRIRQGWKPAPSKQENQYLETEPSMYVACDFDRAGELIEELYMQGVVNAEICLVGWNRMGHDGRYPQIFPVEPLLGGESKLIKLIEKSKSKGYNIVGHDNASDAYTVSEEWDEEYLLKEKNGSLHKMDIWSSGRAYKICPKRYYELFANDHFDKMSKLGFKGLHYIDVVTILTLLECHDKEHPLTRKEAANWYRKLMIKSREVFGGFSSESGYDFAADALDYALYTSFVLSGEGLPSICDESIPFWQIVYHGIILYNPGTYTLNYSAKGKENRLKYFEYGGRPLVCVNANFAKGEGKDWMGKEDIRLETGEEIKDAVSKIKLMSDDYEWLKEVRLAYMESHNCIDKGIYEIQYSNGIKITVDYNTSTVSMVGENINKVLNI